MSYSITDAHGNIRWYKIGTKQLHREGGLPAIEYITGGKVWYVAGKMHRVSGLPAIEWANGDKSYYCHGVRQN